ncbi:hypothetical protein ACWDX6_24035 [Streptomyces sp. NPDC003027]
MTTFGTYLASYREDDRTHLLCVGLCRRRKPREEFRETPWHGRAASCKRCETFPGPTGRSLWHVEYDERREWELVQAREKLRMYQRYAQRLRLERIFRSTVTSEEAFSAAMAPHGARREQYRRMWGRILSQALHETHTDEESS